MSVRAKATEDPAPGDPAGEGGPRRAKLVSQKDIAAEWGVPTRDILAAVGRGAFPMPVQVIGKKRWFRRSEVVRYFKEGRDRG